MRIFPTCLTGPNGERRVFDRAEDVPEGWVDGLHPSVRIVGIDVAAFGDTLTGLPIGPVKVVATVSADGVVEGEIVDAPPPKRKTRR